MRHPYARQMDFCLSLRVPVSSHDLTGNARRWAHFVNPAYLNHYDRSFFPYCIYTFFRDTRSKPGG